MDRQVCVICNKGKTALRCDSCGDVACKKCVEFVDEDHFQMISILPDDLKNRTFCFNCYNQGIGERLETYRGVVEQAKAVNVYSKTQTKETRRIKRVEDPIVIDDCEDRQEVMMKLAFWTAEKGFNTIVDVDIKSRKTGDGKRYKTVVWSGSGVPVDPKIKK